MIETKWCGKCRRHRAITDFHICRNRKDGRQTKCKDCNRVQAVQYYHNQKSLGIPTHKIYASRANELKQSLQNCINSLKADLGCAACGEKEPCCLDFHHLEDKEQNVSYWRARKSIRKVIREIKKSVVVCSNCHRKMHANKLTVDETKRVAEEKIAEYFGVRL